MSGRPSECLSCRRKVLDSCRRDGRTAVRPEGALISFRLLEMFCLWMTAARRSEGAGIDAESGAAVGVFQMNWILNISAADGDGRVKPCFH